MTPAQLIEQVYYRTGRADAVSAGTFDTETLHALNAIQREVNLRLNFQELTVHDKTSLQLAALTANYDLPTDFLKMLVAWDNDRYETELRRITPQEYKTYLDDIDNETDTYPRYYDILDASTTTKKIALFNQRATLTTGVITAFADYSGTVAGAVLVTDANHAIYTGNTITIAGTTNYDGTYSITYVSANTFYITAAWVATETGTWTRVHYVPFVYIKKVAALTSGGAANIISTFYPDLLIEGATYLIYRDNLYKDQPEKIAFREAQYAKQIKIVEKAQRQTDRIEKVLPKRIIPSTTRQYNVQSSGYSS